MTQHHHRLQAKLRLSYISGQVSIPPLPPSSNPSVTYRCPCSVALRTVQDASVGISRRTQFNTFQYTCIYNNSLMTRSPIDSNRRMTIQVQLPTKFHSKLRLQPCRAAAAVHSAAAAVAIRRAVRSAWRRALPYTTGLMTNK